MGWLGTQKDFLRLVRAETVFGIGSNGPAGLVDQYKFGEISGSDSRRPPLIDIVTSCVKSLVFSNPIQKWTL